MLHFALVRITRFFSVIELHAVVKLKSTYTLEWYHRQFNLNKKKEIH